MTKYTKGGFTMKDTNEFIKVVYISKEHSWRKGTEINIRILQEEKGNQENAEFISKQSLSWNDRGQIKDILSQIPGTFYIRLRDYELNKELTKQYGCYILA